VAEARAVFAKGGQEVTKDDKDIVSAVRRALVDRVGRDRFELWFGRTSRLSVRGAILTVEVPNRLSLDWLREQFGEEIASATTDVLGSGACVKFRIDESLDIETVAADPPDRSAPENTAGAPGPRRERTIRDRGARLESFVVGDGNRVVVKASEMVVRAPGSMSPLFVHGPHGVGKTHLLEGICAAVRTKWPAKRCVYLSAEQFTSLFLEALHGSGLPSFRRKYRDVGLLALDDVHFFLGKKATVVELLHTIDTVHRHGHQLVLAADRPPGELTGLGRELINRMSSGLVCGIAPPDQRTRLGIVRRWADEFDVDAPEDALRWIAANIAGDARLLRGAVNRLRATSAALKQPINRHMAEEHLADLAQATSCLVRLGDVERAVCDAFELDPRSLRSSRKLKGLSQPRMLAMWLARKYTRAALSEISEHFGRRSHSSVISASRKVAGWLSDGSTIEGPQGAWKVEDALRQIERQLQSA
jgi:chromosomal replication initiator protein